MAYPEKVLAQDEKVVEHLHPHWTTLVVAVLWFLVICAGGGAAVAFLPSSGTTRTVVLIAVAVVAVVLLVWLCIRPWVRWRTTHYVLTTHRVLIRTGVFTHRGRDIALQRINDVGFEQSLFERIVRSGTITIESAGEQGQETLRNIPRSNQVQQTLNRLIEEDADRRARQAYGYRDPGGYPGPVGPQGTGPLPNQVR